MERKPFTFADINQAKKAMDSTGLSMQFVLNDACCPECFSQSFTMVNADIYTCNGCFTRYTTKEISSSFKLSQ